MMDRPRVDRPVDDRFSDRLGGARFSDHLAGDRFPDRPTVDRFSDRPEGDRFSDRIGVDRFSDRPMDRSGDRNSRWSDDPPNQNQRFPRGGGSVDGGGSGFGYQIPLTGQKREFHARGGSPENTDTNKIAKLFIGSVPRTTTEEMIRPLFEEHGDVIEVALIKDRRTGQQQGCCFIKYATSEDAERAIKALHNQYTLPGAAGPIQVRYADGERENIIEHKLFVASMNKQATEKDIEEIFSQYGRIEDVYLMKDDMRQSRGCGFVKFSTREMAFAAMNALNGTYVMMGCNQPLTVRLANPKRPRPGEQRGGPAFGGPGFGSRSETYSVTRLDSNLDKTLGEGGHPNAWNQNRQQSVGSSSQATNHGFGNHSYVKDASTPSTTLGNIGVTGGPTNGSIPIVATPSSSQKNFNPSMAQAHPSAGQQISPLQNPLMPPKDLPASSQLQHNQNMFVSTSQAQTFQAPFGQFPVAHSIGLPSNQNVPPQISASQSLVPHNDSTVSLQKPSTLQHQGMSGVANQQQLPSCGIQQQFIQQPIQRLPTQAPQVLLQQQAQDLQSSFQSSQQAIFQLQQQLQQMQQSGLTQQQGSQATKQQSPWPGPQLTSSTPATTPAAVMPSTTSVPSTCNWTEHTSPEGFKYYYNSMTRESKWEKPEELTLFEQQQQQQKLLLLQQQQQMLAVQQVQSSSQSQSQSQPPQQVLQTQDAQAQMQLRQLAQFQLQPSLAYQASGAAGHQNIPDSYYTKQQAATSAIDPARVQQGIQAAQEWAWKNKPAGS